MAEQEWVDEDAGPVIRPYVLTGGRAADDAGEFDLVAVVGSTSAPPPERLLLSPEHERILGWCRSPRSVAEIASDLDLALGVVRVLLGDLFDHGLILVRRPELVAQFPNAGVLKEMIDELRAL